MLSIRPASDSDEAQLIVLISNVFAEYPGCVMDVDGEIPELRRIASYFAEHSGEFWVAERGDQVVGCIGYSPATDPTGIELKKLYVDKNARVGGLGTQLLEHVERAAEQRGARFIDLWSDTRFHTAHGFYEKRGYKNTGTTRELHDKSDTVEFYFVKTLPA